MSGSVAGDHLEREQLSGTNISKELDKFAEWLGKDGRVFSDINPGCSKCTDKGRDKAIRPLLKELGFDDEDPKLRFNVFRIKGNSYINPPDTGPGGYLIPIRQGPGVVAVPTISNPPKSSGEEPTTQLIVGEKVYFDRRVFVQSSIDCLVVTVE
ncbi:hypothetical protein BGZ60DRAFT_196013 [Tricladium varicosporioides]|nr:hypothetical protein BGZ60DRAFT_196013 [Hymenoscyphus varicosporioides]